MKFVATDRAPAAVGPYSQGTTGEGNVIFISGQLPVNMETGELETDVEKATLASLRALEAIVTEAGGTKENLAKLTVLVTDINDFSRINEVYAEFFGDHKPARALYEVSNLPKGAVIEIEAFGIL